MPSTKEIKQRTDSIKNTSKITNALYLISASKMQKSQNKALKSKYYAETLKEIVNKIAGDIGDYKSPLTRKVKTVKKIAIITIGTSRGFVGSMINNLTSGVLDLKKQLEVDYPNSEIVGVSLYKTGQKILGYARIDNEIHFSNFSDNFTSSDLSAVKRYILEEFSNKNIDLVYLVYTKFVNTMIQEVVSETLLPMEIEIANKQISTNFIYEPSKEEVLDKILPEYFETQLYSAMLNSVASEHSARMLSMKNATDNAYDMVKELTRQFNKMRQISITNEMLDIIGGASA